MNNRKARRSSILKPPKQTLRAPFQDLDSDDDGNLTQSTNRRVSFSRTSQIKEFDPTIGYMTNWHQSYEESLESLESDENQAKSANVFNGLASVQPQKKFKRKRTSTAQLSLTINNDETNNGVCSNSNPSILQNSGARANKQPRKSLDCFQTGLMEEGDTSMFFDELNLTEPVKSSYSNVDSSTNLTMTLMDSMLNCSDADIRESKTDIPTGQSSESLSKCVGDDAVKLIRKVTYVSGGTIEGILPNKDHVVIHADQNAPCDEAAKYGPMNMSAGSMNVNCTKIEILESLFDVETLGKQCHNNSLGKNSNDSLPKLNNDINVIGSRGSSNFEKDKNNIENSIPPVSLFKNYVQYRDSKEDFDGNSSLEASMELTIPQVPRDAVLPNANYSGRNAQVIKNVKVNGEETEDLDITDTWGQIVEQKNSELPSENVNLCGFITDKPKSLMDILNANGDCMKEKVVDSTVNSDMELSMTTGGIVIQENIENGCANLTQGSDISEEVCTALDGMELTVPLGKLKMSKARDDSENIDPQQPFEINEVLESKQMVTITEHNLEDCLSKVMTEQSCVPDGVIDTSYSSGLDEACGMEMTVPLGKIRGKMPKDTDENDLESDVVRDGYPFKELTNDSKLDEMLGEGQKNIRETNVEQQSSSIEHHNHEVLSDSQMVKETSHEASMMRETGELKLQQSHGELDENVENMNSCSLIGNKTDLVRVGMDMTVSLDRPKDKCNYSVHNPVANNLNVNDTNSDDMGMELTVPLGMLREKTLDVSSIAASLSHTEDVVRLEAAAVEITHTSQNLKRENSEDTVGDMMTVSRVIESCDPGALYMELTEPLGKLKEMKFAALPEPLADSQVVGDANPETMGMELTVPLGRLKQGKCNYSDENALSETQIMDETIPDEMGMELTVPLGRLKGAKGKDSADNVLPQNQLVDDTNPETSGMEFTVPLGRMTGVKNGDFVDRVLPQNQTVDETNTDMEMVFTVPSGRMMEDRCKDPNSNVLPQNQIVNSTTAEMSGMELTVPLGRMKAGNNDVHIDNALHTSQIVNDTNAELTGMELTVPLGKMKQFNGHEPFSNLPPPTHTVDETNPEVMGLEVTIPLERMTEVEGAQAVEDSMAKTLVESKLLDDTDLEAKIVYSSVPVLELREENVNLTEKFIAENQPVDLMNLDDDGMEMTIPLGRLRRVNSVGTGEVDSLEHKVMAETNSEEGLTARPVKLKAQKSPSSGIDSEGETRNCERSTREVDMVKSEIEVKGIHSAAQYSPASESTNTKTLEKHLLIPSDENENRDLENENNAEPNPEDSIKMKREGVELRVSLSGEEKEPEDEYLTEDKLPVCKAEVKTHSIDMISKSKIEFDPCHEKINRHVESEIVVPQEEEVIIPVLEAMEHSLSEVVGDELQVVPRANMEFQAVSSETSFGGDELMEICHTPSKHTESQKMRSPVQDVAAVEPLDTRLVSSAANCRLVESDINPSLSLERDEHQFEKRMGKRKSVECEQSVSCTELRLTVRKESKGNDVTFGDQAQKESDGEDADMDFTEALGKLNPQKKKNKIMDEIPPLNNSSIDARDSADKSDMTMPRSNDKGSSIIDHKPSAIDLEVVPSVNSGFASTCGNNQQPLKDPSFSMVNSIEAEEVPMECVSSYGRDSHVLGGDGVEPMDDKCVQDDVEPCGIKSTGEIKSIDSSDIDIGAMEEASECQMANKVSDMAASFANQEAVNPADMKAVNPGKSPEAIVSIEDWLRYESSKESCDWAVHLLFENQFSILVFQEAALLIVNLVPLREGQDSKDKRNVESILLKSCLTDESNWCWKVVMETILTRLSPSFLFSKCSSTEQLSSLLEFLNSEFVALNLLLKQTYILQKFCPVDKKHAGFSFKVPSMKLMMLFEVKINLLNWDRDGIKPEQVQVKNVIGKMGLTEIQSIVQSVKVDEHCLRNIYKDVLNFIDTLEDVLE